MGLMHRAAAPCLVAALLSMGCGDSDSGGEDTDSGTDSSSATGGPSGPTGPGGPVGTNPSSEPVTDGDSSGGSSADETTSPTDDPTEGASDCAFSEDFEGLGNGDPWPAVWSPVGGVDVADVQDGWGRLRPILSGYSMGRMTAFIDCSEIDVSLTFMFTDGATQGIGLYGRQNGGYLRRSEPSGQGYAAFAEAFRDPVGIGAWREVDGQEQQISGTERAEVLPNVEYRMRFRLTQMDSATSLLQAKLWRLADNEPEAWTVERTDNTASIQGVGGALAVDAWVTGPSQGGEAADLLVDDIVSTSAR
jgi:hypothetical protein